MEWHSTAVPSTVHGIRPWTVMGMRLQHLAVNGAGQTAVIEGKTPDRINTP